MTQEAARFFHHIISSPRLTVVRTQHVAALRLHTRGKTKAEKGVSSLLLYRAARRETLCTLFFCRKNGRKNEAHVTAILHPHVRERRAIRNTMHINTLRVRGDIAQLNLHSFWLLYFLPLLSCPRTERRINGTFGLYVVYKNRPPYATTYVTQRYRLSECRSAFTCTS